jgi:hypothetical protein
MPVLQRVSDGKLKYMTSHKMEPNRYNEAKSEGRAERLRSRNKRGFRPIAATREAIIEAKRPFL